MTQLGMTHALKGVTSGRRQFHMEAERFSIEFDDAISHTHPIDVGSLLLRQDSIKTGLPSCTPCARLPRRFGTPRPMYAHTSHSISLCRGRT